MLYVDKYRPLLLKTLDYHDDLTSSLTNIAHSKDLPHLLFYGASGAGKKTRIMAFLREVYGNGVEKMKSEMKSFNINNRNINMSIQSSNYHIEFNPSEAGIHDRLIINEILLETSQTVQLNSTSQKNFKVIILTEADRMTKDAQHTLRRTMEKYSQTCRLILCCESVSRLIEPLRSRCLSLRVPAPSKNEISTILRDIATNESFNLPELWADKIAIASDGNLRRAILMLEASKAECYPFDVKLDVPLPDWQRFIAHIAKSITEQQSPARLLEIRSKLYELLQNCIPPAVIIKTLVAELCNIVPDDSLKYSFIEAAATFEHRMQLGTKEIFHLEAFVAKVMAVYKRFCVQMVTEM